MLLGTLAANVLENILRGKPKITGQELIRAGETTIRAGDGRIRAGRDF